MEAQGEGLQDEEVICVTEQSRTEAEMAFQVYKMLDGYEVFSNVCEYHMVPVQAPDGSVIAYQVTGIQKGEEAGGGVAGGGMLPAQVIELHDAEKASPAEVGQPLPGPAVAEQPVLAVTVAEQPLPEPVVPEQLLPHPAVTVIEQLPAVTVARQPLQEPAVTVARQPLQEPAVTVTRQPPHEPAITVARQPLQERAVGVAQQRLPELAVAPARPAVVEEVEASQAKDAQVLNNDQESQILAEGAEETCEHDETTPQLLADPAKQEAKTLFWCSQCKFSSPSMFAMKRHLRSHAINFQCSICDEAFSSGRDLEFHVNNDHMELRQHKCPKCDMCYKTASDLLRHTRAVHAQDKPFKCCYCDYSSAEANRMKIHIRSHTGERPFACSECCFASTDAFKLRRHLRTHTGEKPYVCSVCKASFTQNGTLKMHMLRKHTDKVQKEQCNICNATLSGKNDVKNHIRKQHSYLEVPITCRLCSEEFHERYLYRRHQESHRSRKNPERKSDKPVVQAFELEKQQAESSPNREPVSWNIEPSTGELYLNYQQVQQQPSAVTELHSIPMQTEDGSIVQAIVVQSGEQVDPGTGTVHAQVYEVQDLAQVFQPLVEQQSSEPIILALDPINQTTQSVEPQVIVPDFVPQAASTPLLASLKGRRIRPVSPERQIEVKLHRCKHCSESFSTGMELLKHKKEHKPENMFKCPFCEVDCAGALELILHIQAHNDERPFHCDQCDFCATDTFKLTRHQRTHTGEKPFSCNICDAKFTQKTSMSMHIQRKHTKELPKLNCPLCNTVLTGKHSLSIHLRKQHSHTETELKCRFCPATFRERFVLREHQKTHRNEKPIKSVIPRAKRRKLTEQSLGQQVNFEEQEPVIAAQAEEYTWQVLPTEQDTQIHFVIGEAEEASSVTEYHLVPVQAEDNRVISIHVSDMQEVEQVEAGTIHQVIYEEI